MGGHCDIVKFLLDAGANVDLQDINGSSSLMDAAHRDDINLLKILLNAGANINLQDKLGFSALIVAAYKRRPNTVKILLDNGADVSLQIKWGDCYVPAMYFNCNGVWKTVDTQESIITKQSWNIKIFDDLVGFLPELRNKYEDAFLISDLAI